MDVLEILFEVLGGAFSGIDDVKDTHGFWKKFKKKFKRKKTKENNGNQG